MPINSEQELEQVVGADRDEIDALQQFVELVEQRRHLDHGADVDALRQCMAVLAQVGQFALDDQLGLVEFVDLRDHRKHHAQIAAGGGAQ